MSEPWMALWLFTFLGAFIIVVTVYDYVDRKKRNVEIKWWIHVVAFGIGFAFMFPVVSTFVIQLPLLLQRR